MVMHRIETTVPTRNELYCRGFEPQLYQGDDGEIYYRVAKTGEYINPLIDSRYKANEKPRT